MAQTTTLNLIPSTPHTGGVGTVKTITGDPKQAASYYLGNADLQTITWSLASSFVGDIVLQATLKQTPASEDWFDVYTVDSSVNKSGFHNLHGNFVWLRAMVSDWTDGNIQIIAVSY